MSMAVLDQKTDTAARARPSLYAAIKLARLVLFMKERFKSRIKSRKQPSEALVTCHRDSFKALAFDEISFAVRARARSGDAVQPRCYHSKRARLELGLPTLLHDLDSHTLPGDAPMSLIAKQDRLFLKYDAQRTIAANNLHGLRHVLDLTTSLLDRLHVLSGSSLAKQRNNHGSSGCSSLKCEKFIANLEHLLQCLQQAAFEALISHALEERLDGDILHWRQHWQQRRRRNEGWFAEWPNGQHPLNTTWPWNVKPSLVILWGVCWMFYDNEGWMVRKSRGNVNESVELNLWTRQPHQQLVPPFLTASTSQAATEARNAATWNDSNINNFLNRPLLPHSRAENSQQNIPEISFSPTYSDPYILPGPVDRDSSLNPASDSALWPYQAPLLHYFTAATNEQEPHDPTATPLTIETQGEPESYDYFPYQPPFNVDRQNLNPGLSVGDPRADMTRYPSPHSDASASSRSPHLSPCAANPGMAQPQSASPVESPESRNEAFNRSTDIARNNDRSFTCVHRDCGNERPVFQRKCEYTKHMDKHNRPHVCKQPGCEKIQGFTYSGGLRRHEREVHRQHGGPKASCMCPHSDCKRSTGYGFSRKENLSEHLRRVHRSVNDDQEPTRTVAPKTPSPPEFRLIPNTPTATSSPSSSPLEIRKRKRAVEETAEQVGNDGERDWKLQVKRLRKELQQKDNRLKRLEETVAKLAGGQMSGSV